MGVQVPSQLSMVSFEDSLLTRLTHPSLTALTRDTPTWGTNVGRLMLDLINDPQLRHAHQSPTPQLVPRESTARAPG